MRNTLCILLFVSTAFNAAAQEHTGKVREPLLTEKGVQNWTSRNNTVPVCWETPGFDREKRISQQAVTETWQFWANVDFVGWGPCPASGDAEYVRIRIS